MALICPNKSCPDFLSTGSPGEYRLGISECPMCGHKLEFPRPQAERPETVVESEEMVPVMTVPEHHMVPLVKATLEAAGIRHFIRNERVQDYSMWGKMLSLSGSPHDTPTVMVEPGREEEAAAILNHLAEMGE